MSDNRNVALGDICDAISSSISQNQLEGREGNFPIYGASGLICCVDFFHHEQEYIGIVKDGAGVGRTMFMPAYSSVIGTIQALVPKREVVDAKYLYYLLNSLNLSEYRSGSTIPHIYFRDYKRINIRLPDIRKQKRIAATLDAVSDLIRLRKRQLEELDLLVKARFVEMFGLPENNPKCFVMLEGKDLFSFSSGKFLEESKRKSEGIPVYGGNGIAWYTDRPLITDATIIIGRVGAYCGNVKHIKEPVWITDNAIFIKKFKTKFFSLSFLFSLMTYMNFAKYADFSGQPKITQKPLENLKYMIPPLDLQEEFSSYIEQVHVSEILVQKALEELDFLKKTIMHQYFD